MYSLLHTENTQGLRGVGCDCGRPRRRTLGAASPLTADQAVQQAIQMYAGKNLNPKQTQGSAWLSAAASAVESAEIGTSGGLGPNCSGQTAQPLNLLKTATGISLSAAGAASGIAVATNVISAATGAIVGAATLGVGAIISVITAIFMHHKQAEARDLQFGCSAIPAVDNAFATIAQGVQQGIMSPQDAANALPQIYSSFMSAGGASGSGSGPGGIPGGGQAINDSPFCNSNCELSIVVLAMVLYWQAQYNAMSPSSAAAAVAGGPTGQAAAAAAGFLSSIPAWAWFAGLAFGAWAVFS